MARPPKGPQLVDGLDGDERSKERLRAVLETVAGEAPIREVCERLGIKEARFHTLRKEALQAALEGLAPKPLGRPRKPAPSAETQRVAELEARVERLETELEASRIREELATAFPERFGAQKGGAAAQPTNRAARRRAARAQQKAAKRAAGRRR